MLLHVTSFPDQTYVPVVIDGVTYFSQDELAREAGVTRQTIWRWRAARKIPQGHRFRDGRVLFTAAERDAVRGHANRVEPAASGGEQLRLFNGPRAGGS